MAYRRPAIEVIQEFQAAAAALVLPTLPACVIGPAFQIANDVNAGTYSETDLGVMTYAYTGLTSGAIVDLSDAPASTSEANAHKEVGVKLKDALLVHASPVATGQLKTPNLFDDATASIFANIDPTVAGSAFYVEILGGAGVAAGDLGRKLITKKNSSNEFVVAAEWLSGGLPLANVQYRILEYRASIPYTTAQFASHGIAKTADGVTINPGLTEPAGGLAVVDATVLLSWRALRPDVASELTAFTDLDSLEAVFGVGSIVPANTGPYIVNLGLQNTTTGVSFTGLDQAFFDQEEESFQSALEFLENKDVYGLALATFNTEVHQQLKTHVEGMSQSTVGRERIGFFAQRLVELEVIVPVSGLGDVTSAGAGNGTSGAANTTFKDPTNGAFISDHAKVGHFLEIIAYTAVTGTQRAITPDERDYLSNTASRIQLTNAAFVGGDVGRYIITRGCTTLLNDTEYQITGVTSATKAAVNPAPNTTEVFPAVAMAWIADLVRAPAHNAADAVVAATKTWNFVNGAFTAADVGRIIFPQGTATAGNSKAFTIASVVDATHITTVEAPAADETFGAGVTQKIFSINRTPGRDVTADNVDGASRIWTFQNGDFTIDDVGRELVVAGATNVGNNATHIIEAFISSSQVRTSNATTPVTEEFNGVTTPTLTTLRIDATAPSASEDTYIKGTRHKIAAVVSESQLTLDSDPTSGFGGTLSAVEYRITADLSLDEQAEHLAGYATSFGSRRMYSMWPDVLAVSVNGQATEVPGFFAGGPLVGMVAGLPSQAGFTNLTLTGFVGRANSDDRFTDAQLDVIAGGGNLILVQPVANAALSVRHQLSTDMSTIMFQELSVTKNVDLISRFFRTHFKPFIGLYNITDGLMDLLKTRGEGGITFLMNQRAPRVGAPLTKGQLTRVEESTTSPDTVEIDIAAGVPLPLNNLSIKILV